jgi:cytochrome oxidase assembly protein ShyY1
MRRLPIVPTFVVGLAVTIMIALGVWQLNRRAEKAAALAQLAQNIRRPPVAFPNPPVGDDALFRRASVTCTQLGAWRAQSGRDARGSSGWRQIADCTRNDGATLPVQLGIAARADATPAVTAGAISGYISYAPSSRPLFANLFGDGGPKRLMLVADRPAPGLRPNAPPDLSAVPNNHLAYAVQWFLFALIALVIYAVALLRRGRGAVAPPAPAR